MAQQQPSADQPDEPATTVASALSPLGGTRAQSIQRLQIGLTGLATMVLLVGLADIIQDRARVSDANAVPEAAATVEPQDDQQQNDPLAEAGVVPDLPQQPESAPEQRGPTVPEGAGQQIDAAPQDD